LKLGCEWYKLSTDACLHRPRKAPQKLYELIQLKPICQIDLIRLESRWIDALSAERIVLAAI